MLFRWFSLQYSFLLFIVFAIQFIVGGFAFIYETQIDDELLHTMNKTFLSSYGVDNTRTIAIDSMHQKASHDDNNRNHFFIVSISIQN